MCTFKRDNLRVCYLQLMSYWTFNIEGQKSASTAPLPSDLSRHTFILSSKMADRQPTDFTAL